MNERTIQHDVVMKYICGREEDGGLGYRETANNIVSNDLFIPAHLAEFICNSEPEIWRRLLSQYNQNENQLLLELKEAIKARYVKTQNAALFFNNNRTINFGGECVPLYYVSGTELCGDEGFNKNIFAAVEESSHTIMCNDNNIYTLRPDISFYLNGIYIGYMELKSVVMGQSASDHGRGKIVKDYLSTIKAFSQLENRDESVSKSARSVHAIFEKAIHLTASDINETYVIRNLASLYEFAHTKLAGATPVTIDDVAPEFIKIFKQYPVTSPILTEQDRFKQTMAFLYSKRMIEKEILYYNFLEYKLERATDGKRRVSHDPRLISPRPKQKFGCDKIMNRIVEMLDHEQEPNYYMNKLRRELNALGIPQNMIEEIIFRREQYCNNKFIYSLLMQYAAGFGKSNIIGWTALQLKDFRYEGAYAYDKIMLVVDRLQLRDQLDSTMRNMNIDKSMFVEAIDKTTFINALDSPKRIIVVNIQQFLDLQEAINESGTKLRTMRVAFLIDEIHRSNSGQNNQEMINLFERLQESFRREDGEVIVKKNLLIGFTATPSETTLSRFGEFKSAQIVPLWVPFDSYTMKEAIEDGYILDPTKHIYPFTVPVLFNTENDTGDVDDTDPVRIRQSKERVYSYEPRMRRIAEFVVDRLLSLVYGKIRGEGKAMFAVSSIPNAIKYINIIRDIYAEKCQQKAYTKYADAPISIVYSDSQRYESCASLNGDKNESQVISEFKSAKNGLIIVVDKLQTGFDEPKLHTLFLDKEISDINAIQTISRVNRTCKHKNECHIIDCSWNNVNVNNIREAFRNFCDMVYSDFNPEEQAVAIARLYKELCSFDLYRNYFGQYCTKSGDAEFIVGMENAFRRWIEQCVERENAIKRQNEERGLTEGNPGYVTPENLAKNLRLLIGQYSSAIESVKNIYAIDEKYYDERFLTFWQIYCRIFRDATRRTNNDNVYVVEPVDIDESGFTLIDDDIEERSTRGGTTTNSTKTKSKTIVDVIRLIERLNAQAQISAKNVQEWLIEIGLFFQNLNLDDELTAYLKDSGFSEEQKREKFHSKLILYCIQLRRRTDITNVERLVNLIKDSEGQLMASYMSLLFNSKEIPDFDFDTTSTPASDNQTPEPTTIEDLIAQAELLFNPSYDEDKVKQKLMNLLTGQFRQFRGVKFEEFSDVVDAFFNIIKCESLEDLDGLNESIPDALNKYFFARNNPISRKNIFKSILLDLEPYLRKICFLKNGRVFDQSEGFVAVAREILEFSYLYNTRNPNLFRFKEFYNAIYTWRNENAHLSPILEDDQVDNAIYMVLCMYMYATMVSVSDLEASNVL